MRPLLAPVLLAAALSFALPADAGRFRYADPNGLGPYAVGHSIFTPVDASREAPRGRPLRTEVWYPVDPENAAGAPTFYNFEFFNLGLLSDVAFEDAPPTGQISFPLIVFSHGSGGTSFQSVFLMEQLASHGFVVVAPNHKGNTANDQLGGTATPFDVSARNRPLDVSFLIDTMIARTFDPLDVLYLKVNPFLIGVAGHSFGGFTSLAMASGYADPDAEPPTDVPPDLRVDAIAPVAPASGSLSDAELQSIDVPVFLLSGTLDTATPIDDQTTRPFDLVSGRPIYRADIDGAAHQHFANVCDIGQALSDFGVDDESIDRLISFSETCRPPAFPIGEAKRIQGFYLTAFFKRHLFGDDRYDEFLTDAWAAENEPDVIWFRRD
ncbi:MAG: hypothetical protein QNK03_08785 [Myxococcota bacterium]|nr:hypothetical protein [Myxococcota bacterium]